MPKMTSFDDHGQLGSILVEFSTEGLYGLKNEISKSCNDKSLFSTALTALSAAKLALEEEIKEINKDSGKEFDDWIKNTKAVQDDINASRQLAHDIVQLAEEDEKYLNETHEIKLELDLLKNENNQNQNLLSVMRDLQIIYDEFLGAEKLVADRQFTNGLIKLQETYKTAKRLLPCQSAQVLRIFDRKYSEMINVIHEELLKLWRALVFVDNENQRIKISQSLPNEKLVLSDVVTGLKLCDDVVELSRDLFRNLDNLILKPRTKLITGILPSIDVEGSSILLGPSINNSIQRLLTEIKEMLRFLAHSLPTEIKRPLSESMSHIFSERILQDWFEQVAPSSLDEMNGHLNILSDIAEFSRDLESIDWPGFDYMCDWAEKFPMMWLNWRRETTLEWIRNQILSRVELPLQTEKVKICNYKKDPKSPIKPIGAPATEDWDAAWDVDEDLVAEKPKRLKEDGNDRCQEKTKSDVQYTMSPSSNDDNLDDTDAWGWGDEDVQGKLSESQHPQNDAIDHHADVNGPTELIHALEPVDMPCIDEYWITEWSGSILTKITEIFEDYLTLSHRKENSNSPIALGLLALPSQMLTMHRAVSPCYYAHHKNGNMFRYNDSIWLVGKLKDFVKDRKHRSDNPSQSRSDFKIDDDLTLIKGFGEQAIANELEAQKNFVQNLLGGARNFFQQENDDMEHLLDIISEVILHINNESNIWRKIVTFSSWASATGAIVSTVAIKIIHDVFLLPNISVDGIEQITSVISRVEQLDDLFVDDSEVKIRFDPTSACDSEKVPLTPKYVDKWMKMKFLSEVLKSNLKDVRFLWFESDLSLYFSVKEIEELIQLSFVMNAGARKVIKEIRENPKPRGDES